ncbi:MAG: oxygenase MpaB family protein [Microthrixaceae bacterium]
MDAQTYVRSDPALRLHGPERLGASALRFVAGTGRRITGGLPARALEELAVRMGAPRYETDPADPPWMPEGGAAWTIHGDPAGLVGGFLSLWIQALHPLVLAGVMEHSKFEDDPLGRLQRTGGFVSTITFAPGSVAQAAVETVDRVHTHITGVAPDGRTYRAQDSDSLDWVHCGLLLGMARCWLRYGRRPDPDMLDDYVAEMRRMALALGDVDPPSTWSELLDHLDAHRPSLAVNAQTRFMDQWLWSPTFKGTTRLLIPSYQALYSAALAAAPAWVHDLYGNRRFLPARFAGGAVAIGASALFSRAA